MWKTEISLFLECEECVLIFMLTCLCSYKIMWYWFVWHPFEDWNESICFAAKIVVRVHESTSIGYAIFCVSIPF